MKIMSEKTGKEYNSVEACLAAEKAYDDAIAVKKEKNEQLAKERKTRATEVEKAYKAIFSIQDEYKEKLRAAEKVYKDKLNAFVKDYGSFHMAIHTGDNNPFNIFSDYFFGDFGFNAE